MIKKLLLLAAVVGFTFSASQAQDRKALRLNEVMVTNTNSITDDYGQHPAWIELFNSNFGPVNIRGMYLTTDKNQPKMYSIPVGDELTEIGKRQHVVFFADSMPNRGTFHTSFKIKPGQTIYLYDADGISLIDEVTIPEEILADQSFARTQDGNGEWKIRKGTEADNDYITPSSANIIRDANHKIEDFKKMDENGFAMTIMAMCIVFSSLLVLCLCFYGIGKIGSAISKVNKMRSQGKVPTDLGSVRETEHDSGEEIAAIIMALHEHFDAHDLESAILTINKVKRAYSPWSSKIYNLRQTPPTPTRK
ncbi:MAG: OadG family protein [Muribaculaceae bacterium]|nr:OadG family protein [Muribaculaceae bacterium]